MNKIEAPENRSRDEIDLILLTNKIKEIFKSFFFFLCSVIKMIFRRWAYFLIVTSLGLALAYGVFSITRPYYSYSMTVLLSEFRNDLVQGLVGNITQLVNEKNYPGLAKELGISEETAQEMKAVHFRNLDDDKITEDSVLAGSPFLVSVDLYSNTIHDTIEKALLNYLETNQYFYNQRRIKKEHLESLVAKLKKDIAAIDSAKVAAISPRGPVNGFVYGEPLDPTNLYRESVNMYERQTALEATLKRMENFDLIVSFMPKRGPSGPDLKKYLFLGAISTFMLGLTFALYVENKQKRLNP